MPIYAALALLAPCIIFPPLGLTVLGFIALCWVFRRFDGTSY